MLGAGNLIRGVTQNSFARAGFSCGKWHGSGGGEVVDNFENVVVMPFLRGCAFWHGHKPGARL